MAAVLQELLPAPAATLPAKAEGAPPQQDPGARPRGHVDAALRAGAWAPEFSVADVSLEDLCAAAGTLMAQWSVLPDGTPTCTGVEGSASSTRVTPPYCTVWARQCMHCMQPRHERNQRAACTCMRTV